MTNNSNPFKTNESVDSTDFKLTMPIKKSYRKDIDGVSHMYIAGLASGVNLDYHGEKMAKSAIHAFAKAIEEGIYLPDGELSLIPLRSGHRDEWDDVLGYVTKAEIDSDFNLWIEAELDEDSSTARDLFTKLNSPPRPNKPLKLGFSVGGKIKKASYDWDETIKARVKVIEDVLLREISVVGSPAYPTAYVEALQKSVKWDELSQEQVQESNMTQTDVQGQKVEETDAAVVKSTEESSDAQTVVKSDESAADVKTEESQNDSVTKNTEEAPAETQDTETDVTKSETVEVTPLEATVEALVKSVQTLTASVLAITDRLEKSSDTPAEVEVVVTETQEETVEKALETRVAESIESLLFKFKTETIDVMASELQAVKQSLEDISGQPLDKSVAVHSAKQEEDKSPLAQFEKSIANGDSIFGAAVKAGLRV